MKIKIHHEYVTGREAAKPVILPDKSHIDHIEFDQGDYHVISYQLLDDNGDLI